MRHKHFEDTKTHFKMHYDLDVLCDVVLARDDHIIMVADISVKEDIQFHVITSSLNVIGLKDYPTISLHELLSHFDKSNNYAKIAGIDEYYSSISSELLDFQTPTNVTFPLKTKNGRQWIRITTHSIQEHPNLYGVYITEVSKYLIAEEELFLKTHLDSLTGMFNKYTMDYHYGERFDKDNFHVLFLDLDDFKAINDTLGHSEGDRVLIEFARILLELEEDYNRFYRLGGDEFVGLFFSPPNEVKEVATQILSRCTELFKEYTFARLGVSIGIVQATTREDVIRKADRVMYRAKDLGKNRVVFVSEDDL